MSEKKGTSSTKKICFCQRSAFSRTFALGCPNHFGLEIPTSPRVFPSRSRRVMGVTTQTVKRLLLSKKIEVARDKEGLQEALMCVVKERHSRGLPFQGLLRRLKNKGSEVIARLRGAPAAPPPAAPSAAPPARVDQHAPPSPVGDPPVVILKPPVCVACGEKIRGNSKSTECAVEECNAKWHSKCSREFKDGKCRECSSGRVLTRARAQSRKLKEDVSGAVDDALEADGVIEKRKKERDKWEAPLAPLPDKLGNLKAAKKADTVDDGSDVKLGNIAIEDSGGDTPMKSSAFIDSSSKYFSNLAWTGAALVGGKSAEKSSASVVQKTEHLAEILSFNMEDISVQLCTAACKGDERATVKARHAPDGRRALCNVERSAAVYEQGQSYKRSRQLVKSVMRNLSSLPSAQKQLVRLQFVSEVAAAKAAAEADNREVHFELVRSCDEDRYYLVKSQLLHFIDCNDYDALWSGLQCADDEQVVIVMNSSHN